MTWKCPSCGEEIEVTATVSCPPPPPGPLPEITFMTIDEAEELVLIGKDELEALREKAWKYDQLCK
jgi:hypothetical protein